PLCGSRRGAGFLGWTPPTFLAISAASATFVPRCAVWGGRLSPNHLLCTKQQILRNLDPQLACHAPVDDEFVARDLLDRQILWLRALENLVHVSRHLLRSRCQTRPIGRQNTIAFVLLGSEHRWQLGLADGLGDPGSIEIEEHVAGHENAIG